MCTEEEKAKVPFTNREGGVLGSLLSMLYILVNRQYLKAVGKCLFVSNHSCIKGQQGAKLSALLMSPV